MFGGGGVTTNQISSMAVLLFLLFLFLLLLLVSIFSGSVPHETHRARHREPRGAREGLVQPALSYRAPDLPACLPAARSLARDSVGARICGGGGRKGWMDGWMDGWVGMRGRGYTVAAVSFDIVHV